MTGKVINNSAAGLLVLILPFAILIVLLFKFWPLLLTLFVIALSLRLWQQYQWKQWSKQVTPFFNQLIKENQGCLTAMDLSMKAQLSGPAAKLFLEKKAEEFGAQRRDYEDKGTVYYFLTASALGSIFEDSEPPLDLESESFTSQAPTLFEPHIHKEATPSESESATSNLAEPPEPSTELVEPPEPSVETEPSLSEIASLTDEVKTDIEPLAQKPELTKSPDEQEGLWAESSEKEHKVPDSLIQAELAKRLEVHSSTIGKRKSDSDFPEWSQSRDPEGIAWEYSPETKEFSPVKKTPQSEQ